MIMIGYVETTVDSDALGMCGCIEEMSPVSRADCTEIDASATFIITFDAENKFEATAEDDLDIEFNACQGTNPSNGKDANNDLASYVYRLNQDGKIDDNVKDKVFETLVGYEQPGNNNNEEACTAAYEAKFGTGTYPVEVEDKVCPSTSLSRLLRTQDNNPLTLEECQDLCYNTDGCDVFSIGLDGNPNHKGVCIGCSSPVTLEGKNGFNSYQMTETQSSFRTSIARNKPTFQSSTSSGGVSSRAVDGFVNGKYSNGSVTHTKGGAGTTDPYWEVDLEDIYTIDTIKVYNRWDSCCTDRLADFTVTILKGGRVEFQQTISGNALAMSTISVPSVVGRQVRISLSGANRILSLAEVEVFGEVAPPTPTFTPTAAPTSPVGIARNKPTFQSSTRHGGVSSRAVDGNTNGKYSNGSVTHTRGSTDPYWEVDLEDIYTIDTIKVYNRRDCCTDRLADFTVTIYTMNGVQVWSKLVSGNAPYLSTISVPSISGSVVRISLSGANRILSLAEVEVFGS